MAVVQVPQASENARQAEQMVSAINGLINPDNPRVKLETFDDVLDCCFLMRGALSGLFNGAVSGLREEIRNEERKKVIEDLNARLETKQQFERRVSVSTPADVKALIKQVTAFDYLKDDFMGRSGFIAHCKKQGIPEETAELIFISQAFDIEKRRKLINENLMMLAE